MDPAKTDPNNAPPPYSQAPGYAPQPYPQDFQQQGYAQPGYAQQGYAQPGYPTSQGYAPQQAYTSSGYPTVSQPAYTNVASNNQTTIVVSQPGMVAAPTHVMVAPQNHMALSIITCLFCFWPVSIFAIIKSNEVDNAVARGDIMAANMASASARKLSLISIGIGIATYILVVVLVVIQVSVASSAASRYY